MARQGQAKASPDPLRPVPPAAVDAAPRRGALPADWLPLALVVGDALIVIASILAAYWYYVNLDPLRRAGRSALSFGPYAPAIPVAVVITLVSLAISQQYRSWRGRTLMDLLLG